MLGIFEKITFKVADVSIATNETFKEIAVRRGGMDPSRVFVVRSIPDLSRFRRSQPLPELKNGRDKLVGYVGIMGAQDGVDLLIEAMEDLVCRKGRRDVQCAIVGSGTELGKLQAMAARKGLSEFITFTGFLSGDRLMQALSTFDVGVIPDPKNTYNDKISMNKVFEYMSLGIPFVGFDLAESRKLAGNAALYAQDNNPRELGQLLEKLVDNAKLRRTLAEVGCARAKALLRWEDESDRLLKAFDLALAGTGSTPAQVPRPSGVAEAS